MGANRPGSGRYLFINCILFVLALGRTFDVFYGILEVLFLFIIGVFKALLPSNILPQKSVRGDVVLITGSGGGLGRQLAIRVNT